MLELRHLRYFIAVAEELSFTRAAERVHIDQTPLSRAVRDLEEELGLPLFEPSGRGMAATTDAHDLLPLLEKKKGIDVQRGAYANQYALRPNWLHPPFNDPRMRLALGYAIDQKGYLEAAVGDPKFWHLCKTYFGCGTPLASDTGTAGLLEGYVEIA